MTPLPLLGKMVYGELLIAIKDGFSSVFIGNKYGLINKNGELMFESNVVEIPGFSFVRVLFRARNNYGFMDFKGQKCIPAIYKEAMLFKDSLACVNYKGSYGYINVKGDWIIEPCRISRARKENFWGYIDMNGNFLINPVFENVTDFFIN